MKIHNHHLIVECPHYNEERLMFYKPEKCPHCKDGKISYPLTPEQEQELEGLLKVKQPNERNYRYKGSNAIAGGAFGKAELEYNKAQSRIAEILTELKNQKNI